MSNEPSNERYNMTGLLSAVKAADSVLLFCHVSPDGDTIGSALALKMVLERLRKRVIVILDGVVPDSLFFLPDIYAIRKPEDVSGVIDASREGTLAIAVDVSCRDRMGSGEALYLSARVKAQIDHHETNPAYADINLVDGDAPATAVIIFRVMEELGISAQKEEAVCLYTALSTDTGNFVYQSTNSESFSMMARLMETGFELPKYGRLLFRRKAKPFVALLGQALPTMRFLCDGEIAGVTLSNKQMALAGATNAHTDGIVDYCIDQAGVRMAYFARETENGTIKVSLRALSPFRVDEVSERFGGGGHQLAAGCTLDGPLDEAVKNIEQALEEAYRRLTLELPV